MSKLKHANIPIFIPHLGCPNLCVFCNQRSISGKMNFDISSVDIDIQNALATISSDTETEIAFFGGSFTGIGEELMESLLKIAFKYVESGRVKSIRCSTRPDYINERILKILKKYHMQTIELGLQSTNEDVLKITKRGHDYATEEKACKMIKEYGFSLVGQMMIGLPGSSSEDEILTAHKICDFGADGARVYPTIVFRESELADMYESGKYVPLSVDEAVLRSAKAMQVFIERDVNVIRVGLCSSENLISDNTYLAGPNHVAIGELCESRIYLDKICKILDKNQINYINFLLTLIVPNGEVSKVIGQNKRNKNYLMSEYGFKDIKVIEDTSEKYSIKLFIRNGENYVSQIS